MSPLCPLYVPSCPSLSLHVPSCPSVSLHVPQPLILGLNPRLVPPGDMYSQDGDADEPEWVKTEREQFVEFRDKNRDGKMDQEETKAWILPSDYDHAEAEARHLLYESDLDKVPKAAFFTPKTPGGTFAPRRPNPNPLSSARALVKPIKGFLGAFPIPPTTQVGL